MSESFLLEDEDGAPYPEAVQEAVRAAIEDATEALRQQNREHEWLIGRMTRLLTETANALKGEPKPLHLHDWSDLPMVARRLRKHNES